MKNLIANIILCSAAFTLFSQEKSEEIIGVWDSDKAHIEIYKSQERFIGNPLDTEGNRIEKLEILNLEYQDGKWVGKLYAKKKDKLMDVVCEVIEDKLLLEVGIGFRKKELEWVRINTEN